MFGRKKDKDENTEKGPSPYDIGLSGTPQELRDANEAAKNDKDTWGEHFGTQAQKYLWSGAIDAFYEGRPENLQTILANAEEFKILSDFSSEERVDGPYTFCKLMQGDHDLASIITLAYALVPEEDKQATLNGDLCEAVKFKNPEPLVRALIDAGADANCASSGDFKGIALARAIENSQSAEVIRVLYDNGASFKDALFLMEANSWDPEKIERLKAYREEITGEAATPESDVQQQLKELKEMVRELTEEVRSLKAQQPPAAPAVQPAAPPAPMRPDFKKVLGGP